MRFIARVRHLVREVVDLDLDVVGHVLAVDHDAWVVRYRLQPLGRLLDHEAARPELVL